MTGLFIYSFVYSFNCSFIYLFCFFSQNYLHSMRVIHGDMKPLNLMVDEDMRCKVGDFGLAVMKTSNVDLSSDDVKIFTPGMNSALFFCFCFCFASF